MSVTPLHRHVPGKSHPWALQPFSRDVEPQVPLGPVPPCPGGRFPGWKCQQPPGSAPELAWARLCAWAGREGAGQGRAGQDAVLQQQGSRVSCGAW